MSKQIGDGTVDFLLDQLDDPAVSARRMFGGYGIYRDGAMFGLVYDGEVYLKVTDEEASASDREPFHPRPHQTFPTFGLVHSEELENRDVLNAFATRAQEAARKSKKV